MIPCSTMTITNEPLSHEQTLTPSLHFDSPQQQHGEEEENEPSSSFFDNHNNNNNPTTPSSLPLACDILSLLSTDEAFHQLSLSNNNYYLRPPFFSPEFPSWDEKPQPSSVWDPHPLNSSSSSSSRIGAGLSNLGNTCFLNAILQCFTHTVPLVEGLRTCAHSFPCDRFKYDDDKEFCFICALRDQIERSLAASGGSLSPFRLVNNLSYFSSTFRRFQQEDAHEFLQFALDKLDKCFRDDDDESKVQNGDANNLVESVFGGRLVSRIVCSSCGHSSNTYELLIDMSLEIENADNLLSALESFTKVEYIEANFKCDGCKEEVSLEKQLLLDRIPSVAAFHLKRFKTCGTWIEKIDKHVDFPLELDLRPYSISDQNCNNAASAKYDLYAVVVHIGLSANSGHYFCYVRSAPDTWHKLDDADVTMVSEDSVLSQKASILFYARQGTPWFSSIMESSMPCWDQITSNTSPKSVLDKFNSSDNSNPILSENIGRGKASECMEFSETQFDYFCKEKLDLPWINVNDTGGDASHGCKQFRSVPNLESVGLNVSDLVNGNSHVESGGCPDNKINCYQALFDFGKKDDGFNSLTRPHRSSPAPRIHLKED